MVEITDAELEDGAARGAEIMKTEPRAETASYDPETGRMIIEMVNGCTYMFPVALAQELRDADDRALADVSVDGAGFNLHWPLIDADLYVPALVAGVFGTRDWMSKALARQAGRAKSPAKAAASRANGNKGGRPRKRGVS